MARFVHFLQRHRFALGNNTNNSIADVSRQEIHVPLDKVSREYSNEWIKGNIFGLKIKIWLLV